MSTYLFHITGMTCHACEQIITMDLEEAGIPAPKEINAGSGELLLEISDDQVAVATAAIEQSGKYRVASVNNSQQ